jgi:hypothetical protein
MKTFKKTQYLSIILLCFIFNFPQTVLAQYTLNFNLPSVYAFRTENLLNTSVLSSNNSKVSCYMQCFILDEYQEKVAEFQTGNFELSTGFNYINNRSASFASVSFYNSTLKESIEKFSRLPVGKYTICKILVRTETTTELARECKEIESVLMQPPRLLYPLDKSTLNYYLPLFTWFPPTPHSPADKINYEYKLVEMLPEQSALEAIETNPELLYQNNLTNTFLSYPASSRALQAEKTYAWQVRAFSGNLFVGATEVWQFTIAKNDIKPDSANTPGSFAILKKKVDAGFYQAYEQLNFMFEGEYVAGKLHFKLFNDNGEDITPKKLKLSEKYGDNRYSIDLRQVTEISNSQFYTLEVTNAKDEKFYLRFQYLNSAK